MKKRLALILAAALTAGALVVPGTAAAGSCAAAMETYQVRTLHVEAKVQKKTYRIGDTVKVDVKVTRPDNQDPAGLGVYYNRPFSEPAADINVGAGLQVGDVFLFGFSRTNAKGLATVTVKLYPWTRPGTGHANVLGSKSIVDNAGGCFTVQEVGFTSLPRAFKVTR